VSIVALLILSQLLMIRLVYGHKLSTGPSKFLAQFYNLKAGMIEDPSGNLDIYLKDFFLNKEFANKLLKHSSTTVDNIDKTIIADDKLSELVWSKLLKLAWLDKLARENDIVVSPDDVDYYINMVGGQENMEKMLSQQGVSMDEYKYFFIEPDILEAKVYNHLLNGFVDQRGVQKIQEAYALLETEDGRNWDEVVAQYAEDTRLSDNSFWLSDEELTDVYEPIKYTEVGGFSKIVQAPSGYVIWHVDSQSEEDGKIMREVRGLFVYAQGIDDFLKSYLQGVNVKKLY